MSKLSRRLIASTLPNLQALGVSSWTKAAAETGGVLDISRTHGRKGAEPEAILVRADLQADNDGPKKLWIGYSDEASHFLNGRLVFYGMSAYRSRDTSFLGILGPFDAVSLLRKAQRGSLHYQGSFGWGSQMRRLLKRHRVEALWTTRKGRCPGSAV
jgi:hypothetical protein